MKLMNRNKDARWGELIKNSEEHTYAQEQLENRNDVRSRSVHLPYQLQYQVNVLIVDGEEAYMPLSDSNSEMDSRTAIKHHQQLHPLSTTGNIHKKKRRRYYIIVELLSWGV
jgi:hypothetical protein